MSKMNPFTPARADEYWSAVRFQQVRSVIEDRARRLEYFRTELLAEPAWDILLEIYAAELAQHPTTVTQLSARISVPYTTSVRWMKMLESDGLIVRTPHKANAEEVWITLSPRGLEAMDGYFSEKRS